MNSAILETQREAAEAFKAMHVVHVVLSLDVGGLERNVLNQVRQAPRLGQRITIICVEQLGTLAPQVAALGAELICLDKRPGLRPGIIRKLRKIFLQLRPDVVHTHQIGMLIYAGPAARWAGVPLVVHTEHGRKNYAKRLRTRWLGRLAGQYAARFFCLTNDMVDAILSNRIVPRAKVRVILNGIDTACYRQPCDTRAARLALNIPPGAPLVGTIGRLVEIKRQDRLIRAFAELKKHVPDAHLMLVGDGPLLDELRTLAQSLGLEMSVHFAGFRSPTTPFLQAMDVFALTSRSEGTPQALLEACIAGIPAIGSRVGGIPEVIEDGATGLLFEANDEKALAAGLLKLLTDKELAQRLADAARARVQARFDIGRMVDDYQRHFLELLRRPSVSPGGERMIEPEVQTIQHGGLTDAVAANH